MIRKRGDHWVVLAQDGSLLGSHTTLAKAQAQLRAIEAAKHARIHNP